MKLPRVQYGAILETAAPPIGFRVPGSRGTRVVSVLAEPLTEIVDWIEAVDLVPQPGTTGPLDVAVPASLLGEARPWTVLCGQVRVVPRSQLRPGALGVLPEPIVVQVRAALRALLDL